MRITRKGDLRGLDIDYQIDMIEYSEEVDLYHKELLDKGLMFMYGTGALPYTPPTANIILHYIDKNLKLYDYAILFTPQKKTPLKDYVTSIDKNYALAKKDANLRERLMIYMKYKKWLYAFRSHLKAYDTLQPEYLELLNKVFDKLKKDTADIEIPSLITESSLLKLDKDIKQFFAL